MLAVVWCSFANLNESTLPLLHRSVVRPFLEYSNTIWGSFGKVNQKCLECMQRRATHLVDSVRHLEYPERLKRLRILTLYYHRCRGDMITVYQMLHRCMLVIPDMFLTRNNTE